MDSSKIVILGLAIVLIVGGFYLVNQNMSSDAEVVQSDTDSESEAIRKGQLASDEMAKKVAADKIAAENNKVGVMVGGAMMLPTLSIVDNAMKANNVTTAVTLIKAAGLVDTLKGAGPFTIFAPTNAAFAALPAGTVDTLLKVENKAQLSNILTYHVVPGRYTNADLKDGQKLKTVQGQEITITKKDNNIKVNGSVMVETADAVSSNGVTHIINGVLMPK